MWGKDEGAKKRGQWQGSTGRPAETDDEPPGIRVLDRAINNTFLGYVPDTTLLPIHSFLLDKKCKLKFWKVYLKGSRKFFRRVRISLLG
jgi:hypothetical protein